MRGMGLIIHPSPLLLDTPLLIQCKHGWAGLQVISSWDECPQYRESVIAVQDLITIWIHVIEQTMNTYFEHL